MFYADRSVEDLLSAVDHLERRFRQVERRIEKLQKFRTDTLELRRVICEELDERHGLERSNFYGESSEEREPTGT